MRAFFDWMVYQMNEKSSFNSGITVIQPIENGMCRTLSDQEGLYHLYLQGIKDGKPVSDITLIDSVQRAINPYSQYPEYIEVAENPALRFLVSNTTEAGISYDKNDKPDMQPQASFPGKVAAFLYHRYETFAGDADKGLIIFCCELIDRNGAKLKEYVIRYAREWSLPKTFIDWVNNSNTFCNTLVDRIVPGFPHDKVDELRKSLGYSDQLIVEGEYFHVWVIEAPAWVETEFPAKKAGLNVIFTDDLKPYRDRKVRVLNGTHTSSFAISLLSGLETVQHSIEHSSIGRFMQELAYEEICPNIDLPLEESRAYAVKTLERFYNPYIRHLWQSIALNSVSKWQTRVLPSLVDYWKRTSNLPKRIVFSLAALVLFYRGEYNDKPLQPKDSEDIIAYFQTLWSGCDGSEQKTRTLVDSALGNVGFWRMDLRKIPGLVDQATQYIIEMQKRGMPQALDIFTKR